MWVSIIRAKSMRFLENLRIDTTPPSTPTLVSPCTPSGDQAIKLAAWSASTDASGVARYDVYEGLTAIDVALVLTGDRQPSSIVCVCQP